MPLPCGEEETEGEALGERDELDEVEGVLLIAADFVFAPVRVPVVVKVAARLRGEVPVRLPLPVEEGEREGEPVAAGVELTEALPDTVLQPVTLGGVLAV